MEYNLLYQEDDKENRYSIIAYPFMAPHELLDDIEGRPQTKLSPNTDIDYVTGEGLELHVELDQALIIEIFKWISNMNRPRNLSALIARKNTHLAHGITTSTMSKVDDEDDEDEEDDESGDEDDEDDESGDEDEQEDDPGESSLKTKGKNMLENIKKDISKKLGKGKEKRKPKR